MAGRFLVGVDETKYCVMLQGTRKKEEKTAPREKDNKEQ